MAFKTTLKTLFLLRHAKAEAGSAAADDSARKLALSGVETARDVGNYLRRIGLPQAILCSNSVRTRETLAELQLSQPAQFSETLYLASPGDLLKSIADVPETVHSLLVIGHNPGLHELACQLAASGDEKALDALHLQLPTAGLVVLQFEDATWRDLREAPGELVDFFIEGKLHAAA